jgi:hypothetical protein
MHGTYRLWHFPSLTDINIHSDTQAEPRKLSSLTLYIDLWQEAKPAPGQSPPVISPPVVIFRRIGVRAEIRTQNPVLSNTRLAKMVPLSHLRRHSSAVFHVHKILYIMSFSLMYIHYRNNNTCFSFITVVLYSRYYQLLL